MKDVSLEDALNRIEEKFNMAACVPVVGFFSGALRATIGKVEAVAGLIFILVGVAGFSTTNNKEWLNLKRLGIELALQGVLNGVRGYGEAMVGITIICSPLLIFANAAEKKEDRFAPHFPYGSFSKDFGASPSFSG